MEHIFGFVQRNGVVMENLKTIGDEHSDFSGSGFFQVVREYPDATITDAFKVIERYHSEDGADGQCYDWYLISDHWRNVDKFSPVAGKTEDANDAAAIAFVLMAEAGSIDDATAGEHQGMFAEWAYPINYKVGNLRNYEGKLYRCHTAHTSQEAWNPIASNLWSLAHDPAEEWPAWSQPIGEHDAYKLGAKVAHDGKRWTCSETDAAGNNIWEPGVFGWTEAE